MDKVDTRPESSSSNFSLEQMEPIVSAFESAADEVFRSQQGQHVVEGDIDGLGFKIRMPHLRKGKHATVGIVDLNYPDGSVFSVVLRSGLEDAKHYQDLAGKHPFVEEIMPRQYGTVGNWAVLERLHGLELDELKERMKSDEDFLSNYALNAWDLINTVIDNDMEIQDVHFVDGHNTIVNPLSGQIRLVEQTSIVSRRDGWTHDEIVTQMLISQVFGRGDKGYDDYEIRFITKLMQHAFKVYDHGRLYIRGRVVDQSHPDYENIWVYDYKGTPKPGREGGPWYMQEFEKDKPDTLPYWGNGETRTFSQDFVSAIQASDFTKVGALIKESRHTSYIGDSSDPRNQPVLVKS